MNHRTRWTIIGLIVAIGSLIRCLALGHDNLWMDEINTLIVATNHGYPDALAPMPQSMVEWVHHHLAWQKIHWPTLMNMLRHNVHLPLYYVLLNPWIGAFSGSDGIASEVALRSFSVCFGILGMVALVGFARDVFPTHPRTWFVAAVLSAFNPLLIYYAQEGRMYTLALFLSTVSLWSLWHIICATGKPPWKASVFYVVSSGLALLTHYIFWFQLPLHALAWLWAFKRSPYSIIKPLLLSGLVLGAILVWTAPMVLAQKSHLFATEKHFSAGLLAWDRYVTALLWQPLMVFSGSGTWNKVFSIVLMGIVLLGGVWGRVFRKVSAPDSSPIAPPLFGIALAILVPLVFQIAVDWVMQTHTVTIVRYTMLIAPAIILLLSGSVIYWPATRWANIVLGVLCVIVLGFGVANVWPNSPFRPHKRFQTQPFAQKITAQLPHKPLIIANGTLASPCTLAYYLYQTHPNLPMLFYVNTYQGQPTYDLNTMNWGNYDGVTVFNYRGGPHRGLDTIHNTLAQHYPHTQSTDRMVTRYF